MVYYFTGKKHGQRLYLSVISDIEKFLGPLQLVLVAHFVKTFKNTTSLRSIDMHFVKFTKFFFLPRKSNYWSSAKIKNNDVNLPFTSNFLLVKIHPKICFDKGPSILQMTFSEFRVLTIVYFSYY